VDITPDEVRARIGARIRELLERRRMTIAQLAEVSGVSRAHVYKVMTGRTSPTSDVLTRLGVALRVDPAALLRSYRKVGGGLEE
jgi:transcriptional regulator with XRE-family HTH domain